MNNYYLKTTSETELWEILSSLNLAHKEFPEESLEETVDLSTWIPPESDMKDGLRPPTPVPVISNPVIEDPTEKFTWVFTGIALDIIGTIYRPTGNMVQNDDGLEYPEMTALDGFHANIIAESSEGLPVIDPPNSPYRVWA